MTTDCLRNSKRGAYDLTLEHLPLPSDSCYLGRVEVESRIFSALLLGFNPIHRVLKTIQCS